MAHNQLSYDWLYTFNRLPDGIDWEAFSGDLAAAFNGGDILYIAAQEESAPSTGHVHWHVFCQFRERVKPGRLCSLLGRRYGACKPNYDRRRGTPEEAAAYCLKEESRRDGPLQCGELQPERGGQGRRRDLEAVAEAVDGGAGLGVIARAHPSAWIRYHGGIQSYASVTRRVGALPRPCRLFILWGGTGVGKTFSTRRHYGDALYKLRLPKPGDLTRWDGYDQSQHHTVLIDEFSGQISVEELNDWCDPWPFDARLFNGVMPIRPRAIVICSNLDPASWWPRVRQGNEQFRAFSRRITICSVVGSRQNVLEHYEQVKELEATDAREDQEAAQRVAYMEAQRLQQAQLEQELADIHIEVPEMPNIDWDAFM